MRAAPTQFRRAVVIAHFQQTRPLVVERNRPFGSSLRHFIRTISSKLAHAWQRASPTCGREKPTQRFSQSDIQFGTREQSQQHWYGMLRRFQCSEVRGSVLMIWIFPVAPCNRFLFGFRVLVPVNSPTCGREKSLNSFTFPSTQRTKRSNDAFRITQHSGIFRPVHTGINCIFEVLCALRPWRRRESDSYTTASVPFRCVPPPRGTTAPPYPGTPFFVV